MTDQPSSPLASLVLCQVVGCTRVAHWSVTGEAHDGEVLYSGLSCDAALHQATCKALAWQTYNVSLVKLRHLDKGQE